MIDFLEKNYEPFNNAVAAIMSENTDAEYIGGGAESRVWRVSIDGSSYAVKIAREVSLRGRPRDKERAVRESAQTAARALGIRGLEQIRAVSVENAVAVYDFAPGTSLDRMCAGDMLSISNEQLDALTETIRRATDVGIEFDGWNISGANAFYDREAGFTLIDYRAATRKISERTNTKFALRSLGAAGIYCAERMGFTESGENYEK